MTQRCPTRVGKYLILAMDIFRRARSADSAYAFNFPRVYAYSVELFSPQLLYTHFQSSHIKSESKGSRAAYTAAVAVKYKFCAKPAWKSFWNKFNYRNLITINPSRQWCAGGCYCRCAENELNKMQLADGNNRRKTERRHHDAHLPDTSRRKNWLHRFEINKSG